jgi:sarcosine oxidase subunit alpha
VLVPAGYGLHVWESLLDEGRDLGVRAVGIEAQRILRLEKGHLIVGQDTDGLTQAFGASLDGLIKLDKDDFVGRTELVWQSENGAHPRLVGVRPRDGSVVPDEGSQLIDADGHICGRVTSSRWSPTLRRSLCLGQVAAELAEPGTEVRVRLPDGRAVPAVVTEHAAAVDPEGARLRA